MHVKFVAAVMAVVSVAACGDRGGRADSTSAMAGDSAMPVPTTIAPMQMPDSDSVAAAADSLQPARKGTKAAARIQPR